MYVSSLRSVLSSTMSKKKTKYIYEGEPPHKEMSWCIKHDILVLVDRYAEKVGRYYKEKDLYRIVVKFGNEEKKGKYRFTHETIVNAVWNAWKQLYKINNVKAREVKRD
jgi:hypothetical protein